jgi:hypothetical protein
MNLNSNYSQFIEHSFRRLTLLIQEQNDLDASTSTSAGKTAEQSFNGSSLMNHQTNSINKNESESFSSRKQYHRRSINDNQSTKSIDKTVKIEPMFINRRTYMRPPKSRSTSKFSLKSIG